MNVTEERYKLMHAVEKVDSKNFFSLSKNTRTPGHQMKLFRADSEYDIISTSLDKVLEFTATGYTAPF